MKQLVVGAATLVAAPIVVLSGTAAAVQTDTFGLAPTDGSSALLVKPDGTTHTSVTVTNRTNAPITVDLLAVGAARDAAGVYSYGAPATGLAKDMRLASNHVALKANASQQVAVDITAPATTTPVFAAVTATAGNGAAAGVQQRLAIIVAVTAKAPAAASFNAGQTTPSAGKKSSSDSLPIALVVVAVVLVAGGGAGVVLARRRKQA